MAFDFVLDFILSWGTPENSVAFLVMVRMPFIDFEGVTEQQVEKWKEKVGGKSGRMVDGRGRSAEFLFRLSFLLSRGSKISIYISGSSKNYLKCK